MKKGLLLSVIASTMIFAGGEISPVDVPAPAADCSDFSGQIGVHYQTIDSNNDVDVPDNDLFGSDVSSLIISTSISVEKNLFGSIGFGAEASGWTTTARDTFRASRRGTQDGGALNQLYLTASFGNTGIQVGRFAISSSLSPLLRTGGTGGVKDETFEGVMVANTDLADTTLYGAWISHGVTDNARTPLLNDAGDVVGAFAFGIQNKSVENTTITAVGYFGSEQGAAAGDDLMAGALTVNSVLGDYKIDAQVAYKDDGSADAALNAAARLSGSFDMFNVWAGVGYTNDNTVGSVSFHGSHGGLLADNFDTNFGVENTAFAGGVSTKLGMGTASLSATYVDYADDTVATGKDSNTNIYVGYKATVAGIALGAQYRYSIATDNAGNDVKGSRVRLDAKYTF